MIPKNQTRMKRGVLKKMKVILELTDNSVEEHEAENPFHAHNVAFYSFIIGRADENGAPSMVQVKRATIPELGAEFWLDDKNELNVKPTDPSWIEWTKELAEQTAARDKKGGLCPHCPSYPITKEELDEYQTQGYFDGMNVGDPVYAQSLCGCYFKDEQGCNCKRADLTRRLINQQDVLVCEEHRKAMLDMGYPDGMLKPALKEDCEFEDEEKT